MPFDKFVDIDTVNEERTKAVRTSLRTISAEELRKIRDEIFHFPEDSWRTRLLQLIAEKPHATFYEAKTNDQVTFLYFADEDIWLWDLPGSGKGPLSETGKKMMKEAIAEGSVSARP